jgi:tetratricopeptide (TPR) repeat protein
MFVGLQGRNMDLRGLIGVIIFVAAFVGAEPGLAFAQGSMAGHDMGMEMKEVPAPETLPVPVKMSGIGDSHLAITASPEAQMWFDQGLNLLHDFWDYESTKAFEQAVRVDPNCAMCYWGLESALAFRSGATGYSEKALASAVRLKKHAGKAERLYIEAAVANDEAAKASGGEGRGDSTKEIAIWRQLVKENPKDLQAKIFLASSLRDGYDAAGEPRKGTKESNEILQDVLKTSPHDSAANHYWIHAMEPSSHPERAIESATLLASLAPASGHMVHMPGHIFYRVGDYAQAEHWFAASTAVDEGYMQAQHVEVDNDWNYVHNLTYWIANLMEEGKLQEATTVSAKLPGARGQLQETLYINSPRDGYGRLDARLPVAMRTGDWAGILKMLEGAKPGDKLANLNFLASELREFATGMQALKMNDAKEAQEASLRLDAELWRMSEKVKDAPKKKEEQPTMPMMAVVMPDAKPGPLLSSLSIMSLELRGSILAEQKQLVEAKALFDEAAAQEKSLGYREPPNYIRPVGETEGLALLRAKDYAGAHKAYETALRERPKSGFSLYGMARASEASGDSATAGAEYAKFVEAWKNGDPATSEMAHARAYLAGQKTVAKAGEIAK